MSEIKKGALQSPANTARTTGTIVRHVQNVDATGKVTPAGEAVGNAPFVKVTDGTSTITSFGGLGQSDTRGLYIIGIDKGTYTVNNGTWPINYTGFTGLTLDNFPHKIVNLTTGQAYSMTGATISSTQITPAAGSNTGLTEPATGDKLFIPVVQSVRAYDDAGDYLKVSNLDPDRNQILNNTQHSAITSATNGTGVYVADMRSVSCCVVASSVTSGGVITVKASPDNTNFATVSTVGSDGIIRTTQTISSSATTYYKVVNCDPMYLRADLTTRTDGTYTIYLQGRA